MEANRIEALELLSRPGWAWSLAHALCRDEAEAQDALGEARLAALRGPVAGGEAGSLRAWVARVVRNAVWHGRRGERRRAERELLAARDGAVPDAERVLEREEARRTLVRAVLAVPEPYRAALIAHYYDGVRPSVIAARAGLPPSTVRNRLARGRALLRRELEQSDGREPRDWFAAVAPLLVRPDSMAPLALGGLAVGTKATLGIAGAAALALLGSLWWWNAGSTPVERGLGSARGPGEIAQPPSDEREPSPERAGLSAERVSAPAEPARRADVLAKGALLCVVDAAGAPVTGAQVSWASSEILSDFWRAEQAGEAPDLERRIAAAGRTGAADSAGECRLPADGGDLAVGARAGGLWNWTIAKANTQEPVVLVLNPSHRLVLEVLDVQGRAVAGVPVGLSMRGVDHRDTLTWSSRTGADGRATIPKLEHAMRNGAYPNDLPFVGIVGPSGSEITAVDPLNPPEDPVRLTLPACGSLRVRIAAPEKPTPANSFWVHVTELTPGRLPEEFVRGKRHGLTATLADGSTEVRWAHVGLGLDLLVEAQPEGVLRAAPKRVRGPVREGEEVLVELPLELEGSRIAARLIGPDGSPVRARWVEMYVEAMDAQVARGERLERGTSGDDGRIVLGVPGALRGARCRWRLVAKAHTDQPLVAEARTLVPLASGELDLGDVQLSRPATFVAGQVLDARGAPAPGVQVSVARWTRMGGEGAPEMWNWTSGVQSPNTDAEGRFHLRDDPPPGRYAIAARTGEFGFGEFVPFERGQQDLVVRLPSLAGLAGRLLLPEGVEAARLRVTIEAQIASGASRPSVVAPRPDGTFDLGGLAAGSYRVSVRRAWDGEGAALALVQDVLVSEGDVHRDPRLDPLDLREHLHALTLEIVDERGAPVPLGHVALQPHGPDGTVKPTVRVAFERGALRLCGVGRSSDVTVVAPGFRTVRVEDVSASRRIALEPGFQVRVRLPVGLALSPEPVGMRLGFWHADHPRRATERVFDARDQPSRQWGGAPQVEWALDGSPEFELLLPQSGTWSVTWVVRQRLPDGSEGNWGLRADYSGNSFVVPADGSPVETLLAGPDPDDLTRVLRELDRD
jgi:RNA polymerase sigma factor (sigma-70 family)